jgi:hypothetical protein
MILSESYYFVARFALSKRHSPEVKLLSVTRRFSACFFPSQVVGFYPAGKILLRLDVTQTYSTGVKAVVTLIAWSS